MLTKDSEPKYTNNKLYVPFCSKQNGITPILNKHTEYILIDNVLSPSECLYLRNLSNTTHFSRRKTQNRDKIIINSDSFTHIITERCQKYIPDYAHIDSDMEESYRYWDTPKINPNWRLVKCNPGSSIKPHLDSTLVESINRRSIFTIMIYLSNNKDGATVIGKDQIFPKEGSVLIFNQNLLHSGNVNTEYKYFIRSEIIYNRETNIKDQKHLKAFEIYQQAQQTSGNEAKILEEKAFEMSPLLESMVYNY